MTSQLARDLPAALGTPATGSTSRTGDGPARVVVDLDLPGPTISRHLYGHFAEHLGRCIYGGFFVGEDSEIPNTRGIRDDVVAALRALQIPNLRWPGGCFADEYHWKDGIGPREQRPRMVNSHWGDVVEDNSFGTHEFMDLVELLGTEAYISGNVGSGTVAEMRPEPVTLTSVQFAAPTFTVAFASKPLPVIEIGVGSRLSALSGDTSVTSNATATTSSLHSPSSHD